MKNIQRIEFKIAITDLKHFDVTLFTDDGEIKASLTCKGNKNLSGSFDCACTEDKKQFYKKLLTSIFSKLVKYNFLQCCTIVGDFDRSSLDRIVVASTESGECLFKGSSEYCFETKQSILSLKCMRSGSTIHSTEKVNMLFADVQYVGPIFDGIFYAAQIN